MSICRQEFALKEKLQPKKVIACQKTIIHPVVHF